MALPNLNAPTFKIALLSENNKEFDFRPFLVKEEKVLLMAQESGDQKEMIKAMQNCVSACSNEKIDGKTLPFFDLQYAFIQIRVNSIGAESKFNLICGACNKQTSTTVNLGELKVQTQKDHSNKIMLTDDVGVIMKYPSAEILGDKDKPALEMVIECVDKIFDQDEIYDAKEEGAEEVEKFINGLTSAQLKKISEFFSTTPRIKKQIDYKCSGCGKDNVVVIDGVENFFE